ncbi:hypothetical protein JTE90_017240 [Oedothorax gibbosus]|uniref:Uncharacterized protein n=1 Tax=Oedothorax gibbosus TaxID=931172 RepID=A0AAV6VFL7_9ARAC|nr:hypothetical protein JTE90_017240 [Oedothorax gibbosus]
MSPALYALCLICLSIAAPAAEARHHHNNNRLMELLTAGIVAKVLQKQEGGDDHHEYYPVPIHVPVHHHGHHGHHDHHHHSASTPHHHHVTEKIIPIPIPHHTTRIIHINADKLPQRGGSSGGGGGDSFDLGGANGGGSSYQDGGGSSYQDGGGTSYHNNHDQDEDPPRHHSGSNSIQQIFFHDSGVYSPQPPKPRYPPAPAGYGMGYNMPYMRPGIVPSATHPAYIMMRARYPYAAVRPRYPAVPGSPYSVPPMYPMPYRRVPMAASHLNPMVLRRPSYPSPMMPIMWK